MTALFAMEGFSLETKAEWSMCPMRVPERKDFGLLGEALCPKLDWGLEKDDASLCKLRNRLSRFLRGDFQVKWTRTEWNWARICLVGACLVSVSLLGCHRSWVQVPSRTIEWEVPLENPEFTEKKESLTESIIGTEHSHPRFYPVPVWDPFHPPADLPSGDVLTGESPTCRPPFFILPTPTEEVQTSGGPEMLPFPRS